MGPRRLSPLTTAFSCGARAHGDAPPLPFLCLPPPRVRIRIRRTRTPPLPSAVSSGSARPFHRPLPPRKKHVSKTKEEKSNTHTGKSATSAPSQPRSSWRGGVLGVRIRSYADLGGRGQSYEDEHLHAQPGYARVDSAERRRCLRMDETQVPRLAVRLTPPSPSFASPPSPASSEKSRSLYPYSPYGAHAHAHAHTDHLHLPSLLAILGGVVRAAFSSPLRSYSSSNNGRGVRGGWAWGRVGTFVAGVLVGVGVGVWVCAA
ncbi:hypothetical protein B0H13DRAFT_1099653 [Mycena leptocephala]|nr:hypothetical protein B0H13DRAFT_1099653 [Mycena leptocephala]